ncbi:hypothetical protein EPN52_14190 [bacterium]|nr:MAG: hypothetical protein EPN52_14190 [bacterium]
MGNLPVPRLFRRFLQHGGTDELGDRGTDQALCGLPNRRGDLLVTAAVRPWGGARRGQALVETALFLPLMLLALFSIVYFGRYGVLDERAQSAIRYGSMISYTQGGVYSAANIYAAMQYGPQGPLPCASNVANDTAAALTQALPNTGPTAQPYWRPDGAAAQANCAISGLGFGGPDYMAFHYFTVTRQSLTAGVSVPTVLQSLLGTTGMVRAQTGFAHADPPGMIMYCSFEVGQRTAAALGFNYTPPSGNPCG